MFFVDVILFQPDHPRVGIVALEIENVADVRSRQL